MYVLSFNVNVYPVPTFSVSDITFEPFFITISFDAALMFAAVILGWQTILVPLVLKPVPFISDEVSVLSFFITSTQSSLILLSLVAIYPTIPLDVIILFQTYLVSLLVTFFSVLVTTAPLP